MIIGVIIMSLVITYFVSTGAIRFNGDSSGIGQNNNKYTQANTSNDPECTGELHEYYSLGFGVEQQYSGNIIAGKEVVITRSCDGKKITITGTVKQTIENAGEPSSINLDSDYNFDGFNDIESLISDGQGYEGIDSFNIYLYDQKSNQFVLNDKLSNLENIGVDKKKRQIVQYFNFFKNDDAGEKVLMENIIRYVWVKDSLVKVGEETSQVDLYSNENRND